MKKFIVTMCISLFVTVAIAQGKFTVPTPTDQQKFQTSAWEWNYAYLHLINYGKSNGKSVEEIASSVGDDWTKTWNKEEGFDGLVNSMLYICVCMVPDGSVEILEQTNSKVVIKVKAWVPDLKKRGTFLNVSYSEFLEFMNIGIIKIADFMGATYSQKDTEDGLYMNFGKK
jgi:hypothetical protein